MNEKSTAWLDDEEPTAAEFAWLDGLETSIAPSDKGQVSAAPIQSPEDIAAQIAQLQAQLDASPKVAAAQKLPLEALRGKAMFQHVKGRKRIWACDGEYVFFRRKSCTDPSRPELVHQGIVRHERFLANGDYTYIETQDDVEICRVNEQSTFFRKGVYLGEMSEGGVRQAVVLAACMRDWPLYVDCLTELASKVKGKFHDAHGTLRWNEHLAYITHLIHLRRGPSPAECSRGMQEVRKARGEGQGRIILLPAR
jgi:hypothetical protein